MNRERAAVSLLCLVPLLPEQLQSFGYALLLTERAEPLLYELPQERVGVLLPAHVIESQSVSNRLEQLQ